MSTIHEILAEFREAARNKRDMGDKFGRVFANFLVTAPFYKDRFSNVWLWTEWPGRGNKPDTGIDLVAEERIGGGLCAIQCKFYDPDSTIQKADPDSFFATSGKAPFARRIVVTTADNWSKNAEPLLDDERVPCTRIRLQDLEDSAVDWSQFSEAGRELSRWHLNYESVEPYPLSHAGELPLGEAALYRVQKISWARKRVDGKLTEDKTTLIYNSRISLTGMGQKWNFATPDSNVRFESDSGH